MVAKAEMVPLVVLVAIMVLVAAVDLVILMVESLL